MKNISLILSSIGILMLISCGESGVESRKVNFSVSGAQAIAYSQGGNISGGRVASTESNLFKIDDLGNVTSVVDDIKIDFVKTLHDGLFIVTRDMRRFYVRLDNSYVELTGKVHNYKGENLNGDIIFDNAKIFRRSTLEVEDIQTTLNSPIIQSVSGDFAILTDHSIFQILNTVNGLRYNVSGCNGPRMIYLNTTTAIIDDCQSKIMVDMTDGTRSTGEIAGWDHEGVITPTGVVLLSYRLDGVTEAYQLGLVNSTGDITLLTNYEFIPGSSSCMNCGLPNEVLYTTGNYFVVRELTKVTVIENGDPTAKFILEGYNVTSISVADNQVYYLAEDNTGAQITGVYNLLTESNQIIESTLQFDNIQTFN